MHYESPGPRRPSAPINTCFFSQIIMIVTNDPTKPQIRGDRVRLLSFPNIEEAREAYKAKVGLKLYEFSKL